MFSMLYVIFFTLQSVKCVIYVSHYEVGLAGRSEYLSVLDQHLSFQRQLLLGDITKYHELDRVCLLL